MTCLTIQLREGEREKETESDRWENNVYNGESNYYKLVSWPRTPGYFLWSHAAVLSISFARLLVFVLVCIYVYINIIWNQAALERGEGKGTRGSWREA